MWWRTSTVAARLSAALVAAITLLGSASAFAEQRLTVNTGHNPPLATDGHTGFHDLLAIEAYRRAGVILDIVRVPSGRSSINANAGIDAGNGPRIAHFHKHFPNLRAIPEKAIDFDFVGFAVDPKIKATSWEDLAPYTVGVVTGWRILEINAAKTAGQVIKVSTPELLFKLLENGRVEIGRAHV